MFKLFNLKMSVTLICFSPPRVINFLRVESPPKSMVVGLVVYYPGWADNSKLLREVFPMKLSPINDGGRSRPRFSGLDLSLGDTTSIGGS